MRERARERGKCNRKELINLSTYKPIYFKFAFTLAEVLITLGIIGIVAAMTIPNLITHYQKESTATQLKKTYSTIAQAVRMSEAENGEIAGWDITNRDKTEIFDKYLAPYMKCSKKLINAGELKLYKPNGKQELHLALLHGAGVYTLLSGVQLIVSKGVITGNNNGFYEIDILVDLNGYDSKPNRFGRDAFFIEITSEEGVKMSYRDDGEAFNVLKTREQLKDGPSNYGYQCNYEGRGIWCGALIERDGWKISDDYPWK